MKAQVEEMDLLSKQNVEAMFEREKYLAAHAQSEFFLRLRFMLLDEIKKHLEGEAGLWQTYETAIEELSDRIVAGELTRYSLTDTYIKEHYKIEDYIESNVVSDMAFYLAGCKVQDKKEKPTMEYLEEIEENMDSGFFVGYKPKGEAIETLIHSLAGQALDIAKRSRDIDRQEGALERFCIQLDGIADENELISKIDRYNDGSYMELWGAVSYIGYYLIRQAWWEDYCKLLDVLVYFPMQGGVIRMLQTSDDLEAVIVEETKQQGRKSIHHLLREQWFRKISEESKLLKGNCEIDNLDPNIATYIHGMWSDFEKSKVDRVKRMVAIWLSVFGKEELTEWISDMTSHAEGKHEKYGKPEQEILGMMNEVLQLTSDDVKEFDLNGKSYATLLTLANKAKGEDVAAAVIKAIANNVFSDKSYPDVVMNEKWFSNLRTIYRCLAESGLDGLKILMTYRKPQEGYRVDFGAAFRGVRQEAYWLAMLLLSLEENSDTGAFGQYVDVLFRDTRNSISSMADDVFTPYYVAELLVSQVIPEQKDAFEKRVIEDIPYLVFVIRVMTANQGEMSEEVKGILAERIRREWPLERKLLNQNKMVKIEFYDKYVEQFL